MIPRISPPGTFAPVVLIAVGVLAVPATGTPVNPITQPIQVSVQVPFPQSVTVRVARSVDGTVVAILGPTNAMAGDLILPWSGGRGPGGSGQPLPDGTYMLQGVGADGLTPLPTTPVTLDIDVTPPRPVLSAPAPVIPASTQNSLPLRPGGSTEVRAIVRRPGHEEPLVSGAWRPAVGPLVLPAALRTRRVVGTVEVTAEARDAAGNIATSNAIIWSVQPPAGPVVVMQRVRTRKPLVAITVDDGYGSPEAARMIEAARVADVTITFCFNAINQTVWGASLRRAMRDAVRSGHLDGCNHGYAHNTGSDTRRAEGITDLSRNSAWDQVLGVATGPFYRPPYGAYGPGLLAAARATGYRYVVLWDVDTNDWQGPSASVITQRAVGGARRGSIILMHTKPNSAAALPGIIRGLKRKGLQPVGLGELLTAGRPE